MTSTRREISNLSRFRGQIAEVSNRNTFVSLALATGYNAYLPVYDAGIDFILYRETDGAIRKVQLKSRWSVDKKYLGRDLWVAFPIDHEWHLAPHDEMVRMAPASKFLETNSWKSGGLYYVPKPSKALVAACLPFRFGSITRLAAEIENGSADCDGVPAAIIDPS